MSGDGWDKVEEVGLDFHRGGDEWLALVVVMSGREEGQREKFMIWS